MAAVQVPERAGIIRVRGLSSGSPFFRIPQWRRIPRLPKKSEIGSSTPNDATLPIPFPPCRRAARFSRRRISPTNRSISKRSSARSTGFSPWARTASSWRWSPRCCASPARSAISSPSRPAASAAGKGVSVISVGAESTQVAEAPRAPRGIERRQRAHGHPAGVDRQWMKRNSRSITAACSRSVAIPVIVQDASGYVGRPMSIALQARLLDEFGPERVLFKPEASPIGPRLSALRDATSGTARVFEGTGGIALVDSYQRGVVGTMPGADLIAALVPLWHALEAGDLDAAARIHEPLSALISMQTSLDGFLAVEKHLLIRQGIFRKKSSAVRSVSCWMRKPGARWIGCSTVMDAVGEVSGFRFRFPVQGGANYRCLINNTSRCCFPPPASTLNPNPEPSPMTIDIHSHAWPFPESFSEDFIRQASGAKPGHDGRSHGELRGLPRHGAGRHAHDRFRRQGETLAACGWTTRYVADYVAQRSRPADRLSLGRSDPAGLAG